MVGTYSKRCGGRGMQWKKRSRDRDFMSVQQESKHSQPEQVCLLGSGFVIPGAQSATVQEYGYITSSRYSLQCWLLNSELQGSVEISLAGLPMIIVW